LGCLTLAVDSEITDDVCARTHVIVVVPSAASPCAERDDTLTAALEQVEP
jgi:hypothetical protein